MRRREFLLLVSAEALSAQSRGDLAGVARDRFYQALELLWSRSTPQDIHAAIRHLDFAIDKDGSFGDAFYYRAKCYERLRIERGRRANDLEKARLYESEALRDKVDPFILAAPNLEADELKIGQKWALLVGISKFQAKGPRSLRYAASDASALAAVLKDPNIGRFPATDESFVLLTDEKATTAAIKSELNRMARKSKSNDLLLFFIATHGSPADADHKGVHYLFTYDTDVSTQDRLFATALAMPEIDEIIRTRCAAHRTVVLLDTCHSGGALPDSAARSFSVSNRELERLREGAGRYILASAGPEESAYEANGQGYFTRSLIEHVSARAGCIRIGDLFEQVRADVQKRVWEEQKKKQTPLIGRSQNAIDVNLGAAPGSSDCGLKTSVLLR